MRPSTGRPPTRDTRWQQGGRQEPSPLDLPAEPTPSSCCSKFPETSIHNTNYLERHNEANYVEAFLSLPDTLPNLVEHDPYQPHIWPTSGRLCQKVLESTITHAGSRVYCDVQLADIVLLRVKAADRQEDMHHATYSSQLRAQRVWSRARASMVSPPPTSKEDPWARVRDSGKVLTVRHQRSPRQWTGAPAGGPVVMPDMAPPTMTEPARPL